LDNQERHQDDRHAELRRQRPSSARPGNLDHGAFRKELSSVSDEDFKGWSGVSPVVAVSPPK